MNQLQTESSLYLRQHAENPVYWHPWGDAAIAKAKELDKPIFLSVGYSACHWCHVMAHESFEDASTAAIMNEHFINIKVDREERPDIDQIYMTAHGILNRGEGGGWPLSVWLTPDLKPFYAGTYFPPTDKYGRPSFRKVLLSIAQSWHRSRDKIDEIGDAVQKHLSEMGDFQSSDKALSSELIGKAVAYLHRAYDPVHGGFGRAPKFPHALDLQLCLREFKKTGDEKHLDLVCKTLEKMALGGIYDQVGGGFHRYSVDQVWLVPHFEKMLYDNAQLPPVYMEAFQLIGENNTHGQFYRKIACDTLDYVLREMTSEEGGFYSTQDADTEGEEGKFFVWSESELDTILGENAEFAKQVFRTSTSGNFEGHNILHRALHDHDEAKRLGIELDLFRKKLSEVKCKLYGERSKRVWPGRDEKILTAWNGLMIHTMANTGMIIGEQKYIQAACNSAKFIFRHLRDQNNRLFRTCGIGLPAKFNGYLDDYAYLLNGLITLYEATFDEAWLNEATLLAKTMHQHFADAKGGYFYTADDHEKLITRTRDMQDGSVPSANGVAAMAMLRLHRLTGEQWLQEAAEKTIQVHQATMDEHPMAASQMLAALDYHLSAGDAEEFVVCGLPEQEETQKVVRQIRSRYSTARTVVVADPKQTTLSLFAQREMVNGELTVYYCRHKTCKAPWIGLKSIQQQLEKVL